MVKKRNILISLLFWLLVWEILAYGMIKDLSLFPSVEVLLMNTWQLLLKPQGLSFHLGASAWRFLLAALVSVPLAFFLALCCAYFKTLGLFVNTFVSATYPLPKVALFPFVLLLFGTDDGSKVFLIGIGIFYLVFINSYDGASRLLDGPLHDIVKVYGVKKFNFWYFFLTKGSLSSLLVGLKTGLGYGITLVVVSEWTMSNQGLGYFIWSSWDQFRIIDMYSGVFILAVVGWLIHSLISFLQTRVAH